MVSAPVRVQLWADVRCPWCWMGHRRLQAAIERLGLEVGVEHRSFLLEPDGPASGDRLVGQAAVREWGLTAQGWAARRERIEQAGLSDGLSIRMETARLVDSRDAHRVLKLAAARGVDPFTAWEAMFAAHLERNRDLGDWETLARVGAGIGLDREEVLALAGTDEFFAEVMADHHRAQALGIEAVPTLVHGSARLSGSRNVGELEQFLRSVPAEVTA